MKPTNALAAVALLGALASGATSPVAAQAPADVPGAAIDPVGTFDFVATFGIEMRTGTIAIRPAGDGTLAGELRLQGESQPALIDDVVVQGDHVRIVAFVNGQMLVTTDLDFAGPDAFTGTIAIPNDSVVIDGTRRTE